MLFDFNLLTAVYIACAIITSSLLYLAVLAARMRVAMAEKLAALAMYHRSLHHFY